MRFATRAMGTRAVIFGVVVFLTIPVQAVTCPTCNDQLAGCQGGNTCPFLATTSENARLIAGTVTAGYLTVPLRACDVIVNGPRRDAQWTEPVS